MQDEQIYLAGELIKLDRKARLSARRMDSRKPVETVLNDHRLAEVDLI